MFIIQYEKQHVQFMEYQYGLSVWEKQPYIHDYIRFFTDILQQIKYSKKRISLETENYSLIASLSMEEKVWYERMIYEGRINYFDMVDIDMQFADILNNMVGFSE
jgi:hypothetical protein